MAHNERPKYRVKTLPKDKAWLLNCGSCNVPSFHKSGSVIGMKKQFYGMESKLVRCGNYIYNVSEMPEIYDMAK